MKSLRHHIACLSTVAAVTLTFLSVPAAANGQHDEYSIDGGYSCAIRIDGMTLNYWLYAKSERDAREAALSQLGISRYKSIRCE